MLYNHSTLEKKDCSKQSLKAQYCHDIQHRGDLNQKFLILTAFITAASESMSHNDNSQPKDFFFYSNNKMTNTQSESVCEQGPNLTGRKPITKAFSHPLREQFYWKIFRNNNGTAIYKSGHMQQQWPCVYMYFN